MSRSAIRRLLASQDGIGHNPPRRPALSLEPVEEAAAPAGVARDALHGFDAQQHGVGVAIEPDLDHALRMSRGLAFFHSALRERDQYTASPLATVRRSASR